MPTYKEFQDQFYSTAEITSQKTSRLALSALAVIWTISQAKEDAFKPFESHHLLKYSVALFFSAILADYLQNAITSAQYWLYLRILNRRNINSYTTGTQNHSITVPNHIVRTGWTIHILKITFFCVGSGLTIFELFR